MSIQRIEKNSLHRVDEEKNRAVNTAAIKGLTSDPEDQEIHLKRCVIMQTDVGITLVEFEVIRRLQAVTAVIVMKKIDLMIIAEEETEGQIVFDEEIILSL